MLRFFVPFGLAAAALAAYTYNHDTLKSLIDKEPPKVIVNDAKGTIYVKLSSPFVVNTWPFVGATQAASDVLSDHSGTSAVDAVEKGVNWCELHQCDGTVGFGGSPAEDGSVFLDAMIIDGDTHRIGSVINLPNAKKAISVARGVASYTTHSILTGEAAGKFATEMQYETDPKRLRTPESDVKWSEWKNKMCQPNYRRNVVPDPFQSCGPYKPETNLNDIKKRRDGHDTIGMIVVDGQGKMAVGTSTNGMKFKVPGRVADSAIPGSGGYAQKNVGGAVATGDGDVIVAFAPSAIAVDRMQTLSLRPDEAARASLARLSSYGTSYEAAIVVANPQGEVGAACVGFPTFTISYWDSQGKTVRTTVVKCPSA